MFIDIIDTRYLEEVDGLAAAAAQRGHVGAGVEGGSLPALGDLAPGHVASALDTCHVGLPEVQHILGHLVHGGPVLGAGHASV